MIEREARDRAAALVQGFWSGEITNRALEQAWPDTADRGVLAVGIHMDGVSSDFRMHLGDDQSVKDVIKDTIIINCICFLRSNDAYPWPIFSVLINAETYPKWAIIISIGTLWIWNKVVQFRKGRYWQEMLDHGDVDAWPFRYRRKD